MAGLGWRLTRGRGGRHISLIACAVAALVIAFVGKAEPSMFDRVRAALSDGTGPVLSEMRVPLFAVERWIGNIGGVFTVYRENMQLRQENAELHKWQDVALSLEDRMRRYESLLNAVPDPKPPFITARVIGESSRPFIKTMILNAGTAQQVKKGQAVVDKRGLLGRIYVTGTDTSWVILLSDLSSRVPVVIEPSHRRAILIGDNTPAPQLELDVGDGPIRPGDRVLSTGDGGLLPPDLPIGVVMGQGSEFRAALSAAPGTSDVVQIVDYRVPEPPSAADPAPGAPSQSRASNGTPADVTAVAARPVSAASPNPLASRSPAQPDSGIQDEELDR